MSRLLNKAKEMALTPGSIISPVIHGLGDEELSPHEVMRVLDEHLRAVWGETSFGLKYEGITYCSPEEALSVISPPGSPNNFDVSKSTMYMVRIDLSFEGTPFRPRYLDLPYTDNSILMISGVNYVVIPTLTDKRLSPGWSGIFLRFQCDKFPIEYIKHYMLINGKSESRSMPYAVICRKKPARSEAKLTTKAEHALMYYLLAKYGYTKTLKMALKSKVPKAMSESEARGLDKKQYTVFSSTGIPPTTVLNAKAYRSTDIAFAIKTDDIQDMKVLSLMMTGVFYILDHHPNLTRADIENTATMSLLLGGVLFGNHPTARLQVAATTFQQSLDGYVDDTMVRILRDEFGGTLGEDFSEDGFYKTLIVCYRNFDTWRTAAGLITGSAWDKRLDMRYNILYPITSRINRINSQLTKMAGRYLSYSSCQNVINRGLTRGIAYAIRSNRVGVSNINYPGDHKAPKASTNIHIQLNTQASTGNASSRGKTIVDDTTLLHYTHPVAGTLYGLSGSRDSILSRLNIFAPYDAKTKTFIPSSDILEGIQRLKYILSLSSATANVENIPEEFNRYVKEPPASLTDKIQGRQNDR